MARPHIQLVLCVWTKGVMRINAYMSIEDASIPEQGPRNSRFNRSIKSHAFPFFPIIPHHHSKEQEYLLDSTALTYPTPRGNQPPTKMAPATAPALDAGSGKPMTRAVASAGDGSAEGDRPAAPAGGATKQQQQLNGAGADKEPPKRNPVVAVVEDTVAVLLAVAVLLNFASAAFIEAVCYALFNWWWPQVSQSISQDKRCRCAYAHTHSHRHPSTQT